MIGPIDSDCYFINADRFTNIYDNIVILSSVSLVIDVFGVNYRTVVEKLDRNILI